MDRLRVSSVVALLASALVVGPAAPASAADVDCSGGGSLADAVASAAPGATITVAGICNEELAIVHDVTIVGEGQDATVIDGTGLPVLNGALITVAAGVTLTMEHIAISNANGHGIDTAGGLVLKRATVSGNATGLAGGGIRVTGAGTIDIDRSVISGNAAGGKGGGISGPKAMAPSRIDRSVITDNYAGLSGGGINAGPGLVVSRSTIAGNGATGGDGGGIYAKPSPNKRMLVNRSTISGNIAGVNGGGIAGKAFPNQTTITKNTASNGGGIGPGTDRIRLSLVAGNTAATNDNCDFTAFSLAWNMVGPECTGLSRGPRYGATDNWTEIGDPRLLPLADNGGPTPTHELELSSPARDARYQCEDFLGTDQRGVKRPQGPACDFGSVEAAVIPIMRQCDFDGDGYDDLPIGVAGEDLGQIIDAGAVHVLYGSEDGLTSDGAQLWHQNSPGIAEQAGTNDHFGEALLCGDIDEDGYGDLAIGVPREDRPAGGDAGVVHVLYGSATGLTSDGSQLLVPNDPKAGELFGHAVEIGRFKQSTSVPTLAVGAPGDGSGRVDLFRPAKKLSRINNIPNPNSNFGSGFGTSLAVGDFDGDGLDDLASGMPRGSGSQGGGAVVLWGSPDQGKPFNTKTFVQSATLSKGSAYGFDIAAGDFNDDGIADLAVGEPTEAKGRGVVDIWFSSQGAPINTRVSHAADAWGVTGKQFDNLGVSLTVGDFNRDGIDDLAAGAPGYDAGGKNDAGAVGVLYGAGTQTLVSPQWWSQDSQGILSVAEAGDLFGRFLAHGNFDGDNDDDLVVSAPGESISGMEAVGQLHVLLGRAVGLGPLGDSVWNENRTGVGDGSNEYDQFGWVIP